MPSLPNLFRRRRQPPQLQLQQIEGSAILQGTESVPKPQKPKKKPSSYPNISKIEAGADPQSQSLFFNVLPIEIRRLIYKEMWALSGLAQHVYITNGSYTHSPCIVNHSAPDARQTELELIWPESDRIYKIKNDLWRRRLVSSWCNHWPCEEAAACNAASTDRPLNPFLPMLLACRQTYLECRASIFEHVTFTICSISTAYDFFLSRGYPIVDKMRFINLSFVLHTNWFMAEEDIPYDPNLILHKPESAMWKSLQEGLSTFTSLTKIDIWIDCYDDRCCEALFQASSLFALDSKTAPKATFILPACDEQQLCEPQDGVSIIRRGKQDFHGDILFDLHAVWRGQWLPIPPVGVFRGGPSRRRYFPGRFSFRRWR